MSEQTVLDSGMAYPSSPLLRLPRELRDHIYRFVLTRDRGKALQVACPQYYVDSQHRDGSALYSACEYHAYHPSYHHATRIVDLDILRINSQIHMEAQEIFLEENTFIYHYENLPLREDVMRHAPNIIASFRSGCFQDGAYSPTAPIPRDLSRFVTFLKSRPPLKRLELTLWGRGWDSHAFQELFFDVKVKVRVTIEVQDLQGNDFREGPYTLSPEVLSDEDKEFRVLTKNLESTMLDFTPPTPAPIKISPLLRLPRELRDKIYRYILVHEKGLNASCPDCNHYLYTNHHTSHPDYRSYQYRNHYGNGCGFYARRNGFIPPNKVLDLDIIRVNHQIHTEALEVFHKGNTFQYNVLRPKAMRHASRIKERFCVRDQQRLAKFVNFLQSRPKLNNLYLTLHGSTWNWSYLRFLLVRPGCKVRKHVSLKPEIPYWDMREGPGPLYWKFCDFVRQMEKDMLVSSSHSTAPRAISYH